MSGKKFQVRELVQLDSEYRVHGNPSLFRIRSIKGNTATLGQLSDTSNRYVGVDTTIDLDDPDLVRPYPEVLAMYPRHTQ